MEGVLEHTLQISAGSWVAALERSAGLPAEDLVWITDASPDAVGYIKAQAGNYLSANRRKLADATLRVLTKLTPGDHELRASGDGAVFHLSPLRPPRLPLCVAHGRWFVCEGYGISFPPLDSVAELRSPRPMLAPCTMVATTTLAFVAQIKPRLTAEVVIGKAHLACQSYLSAMHTSLGRGGC
jgi:hypothetical protein